MAAPHKNPSRTQIPMQLVRMSEGDNCHILINARLAGRRITLIVDTGCSFTTIRSDMKHLGKPIATEPPTDQAYTLGGAIDGYEFAEVDTLVIGRLKLPPTTVALMEFHDVEKIYREGFGIAIDGLLGSDILNQCRAVISYARGTLTLRNPESPQSPS